MVRHVRLCRTTFFFDKGHQIPELIQTTFIVSYELSLLLLLLQNLERKKSFATPTGMKKLDRLDSSSLFPHQRQSLRVEAFVFRR